MKELALYSLELASGRLYFYSFFYDLACVGPTLYSLELPCGKTPYSLELACMIHIFTMAFCLEGKP